MNGMKTYTVTIFGEQYSLVSTEPEDQVLEAARKIDMLMQEVSRSCAGIDERRVAVLTALRCAHELVLLQRAIRSHETQEQLLVHRIQEILVCE